MNRTNGKDTDMSDNDNLSSNELYINRELSLLQFNRRVLDLAMDDKVPLLQRLFFLCISSSNLDEFFEIRAASVRHQLDLGVSARSPDGMTLEQQLEAIGREAHQLVDAQYKCLNETLIPLLAEENIRFVRRTHWNDAQRRWVKDYFRRELLPLLTPLGLDHAHPFPRILNKSLNFAVTLEGKDAFGRDSGMAVVQAPRALPRIIRLPEDVGDGQDSFVFLSSIIHAHVDELFPGMEVTGCYQFRVTRNSDLFVEEEEIEDLLKALEGELRDRHYGDAVRLEVADNCPDDVSRFLLDKFGLSERDLYQVKGPVNLHRLMSVVDLVNRPDLKYPRFSPGLPKPLTEESNILDAITKEGSILLHHPFQSFNPVVDFVRQAAGDPDVMAIKQTLYRTGADSAIADALVAAARAGKEVTAVIELRARFDEEANIRLATRLQQAGAYLAYGAAGHKIPAKMNLVVRSQGAPLKCFVHLGTGNYHPGTAKAYTDYGLLTDDRVLGEDVHRLFMQLTGLGRGLGLSKILQSPFTLHEGMLERIRREAEHARVGHKAEIRAKMNALIEPRVIEALYEASQAGVKIDLIVRGVCCLRPGVRGVSENIHVRSVMGRFLEHTRVFYFRNNGEEELFLSSADWMPRNFFRRVEACFPVEDRKQRRRVIKETFDTYLADNTQAWVLQSDGSYKRLRPVRNARPRNAHDTLLEMLAD